MLKMLSLKTGFSFLRVRVELDLKAELLLGNRHPLPGDDNPLNLCGSLVDLVDLGVSHQLLSGVLSVEPVSTEDLNRVGSRLK